MSQLPSYVVSDIHLGIAAETEKRFRRFLAHVAQGAEQLVINGDLFDFWFEYKTVVPSAHFRVLAELATLSESGVKIRFVGGNHDAWAGDFLQNAVDIELLPEEAVIDLAGRRALLVHGDGIGAGDLGYRILKRVIRHPLSVWTFRTLHPDLGARIARLVSTTESKQGDPRGTNYDRADALAKWASEMLAKRPDIDLVLAGHTHTPTVTEIGQNRFYINTGDWINNFTYLEMRPGTPPELKNWE